MGNAFIRSLFCFDYNRSIPGALKNAIDWASRAWGPNAFDCIPAAVIGASVGHLDTAVGQQSLRAVLSFSNARQMTAPEAYIHQLAGQVLASGTPRLQRYGVSDDDAFAAGLTCGGILDVFVEKVDRSSLPQLGAISADVSAGRPVAVCTVIQHPDPGRMGRRLVVRPDENPSGSLGSARIDSAVAHDASPAGLRHPSLVPARGSGGRGSATRTLTRTPRPAGDAFAAQRSAPRIRQIPRVPDVATARVLVRCTPERIHGPLRFFVAVGPSVGVHRSVDVVLSARWRRCHTAGRTVESWQ